MTSLIEVKEFLDRLVGYIPIRMMHTEFALAASLEPGTLAVSNDLASRIAKFQTSFQVNSASTSFINPRHTISSENEPLEFEIGDSPTTGVVLGTLDQGDL